MSATASDKIHFLVQDRRSTSSQSEFDKVKAASLGQVATLLSNVISTGSGLPPGVTITDTTSECSTLGVAIEAQNTDAWIAVVPNGDGFLSTTVPDGTVDGGICRGINAMDFQMQRSQAHHVAQGDYSMIGAGQDNLTQGTNSAIIGGENNYVSTALSVTGPAPDCGTGEITLTSTGTSRNAVIIGGRNNIAIHDNAVVLGEDYRSHDTNTLNVGGGFWLKTVPNITDINDITLELNGTGISPFRFNATTVTSIEPILGTNSSIGNGYSTIIGGQCNSVYTTTSITRTAPKGLSGTITITGSNTVENAAILGGKNNVAIHNNAVVLGEDYQTHDDNTLNVGGYLWVKCIQTLNDVDEFTNGGSSTGTGISPFQFNATTTTSIEPILGSNSAIGNGFSTVLGGQCNSIYTTTTITRTGPKGSLVPTITITGSSIVENAAILSGRNNVAVHNNSVVMGEDYQTHDDNTMNIGGTLWIKCVDGVTDVSEFSGGSSSSGGTGPFQFNSTTTTAIEPLIGNNVATGEYAFIGGGRDNLASGQYSAVIGGRYSNASGNYSLAGIGATASGNYSIAIGKVASATMSNSIAIGTNAYSGATGSIVIGHGAYSNGETSLNFPNSLSIVEFGSTVVFNTTSGQMGPSTSTRRNKKNIRDLEVELVERFMKEARSRRFEWNQSNQSDIGLIAEEVVKLVPEVVPLDKQGVPVSINYDRLTAILIMAFQKMEDRVNQLETEISNIHVALKEQQEINSYLIKMLNQ